MVDETGAEGTQKNETGVGQDYSSILADALKKKDEQIQALQKSSAEQIAKLTDMVINGQPGQKQEEQKVVYTAEEIKKLQEGTFSIDSCNMDIASNLVQLYDARKSQGINPLLPVGVKISPDVIDEYRSEQTIECLRQALDTAKGDKQIFQMELVRLMKK